MIAPDPWEIGRSHERTATPDQRTARGAWYTPRSVAEAVAELALPDPFGSSPALPRFAVDPTCGGGAFLLATLDRLVANGLDPAEAIGRVAGIDVDEGAVAAAQESLDMWAAAIGVANTARFAVANSLEAWPTGWPQPDLIIGNPPFQTPLKGQGFPDVAHEFRLRNAEVLGPYADLAAVHLLHAVQSVADGGQVALILPQSLLAGRDARKLRDHIDEVAPPRSVWASADRVFDANVRVWAPVLVHGGGRATRDWAEMVADELGAPTVSLASGTGLLGDLATATAGFRDEYYGLAAACTEAVLFDDRPKLLTVGTIDPLQSLWGEQPTTFAKQRWHRPVVERADLPDDLLGWVDRQLRPKVLLPTQSKVFEPFVDRDGSTLPVTPVLSIHARPEDLDLVATVLLAPPVVAWAYRRWFGTAMSVQAIKLAAKDVAGIPLPADVERWRQAADLVVQGPPALLEIGRLMTEAYDGDDSLLAWWQDRLS